jgi:hypothetical protein
MFVLGTAAGGVMLGGFTVATLTTVGWLSPRFLFLNAAGFFAVGCSMGSIVSALLGVLGRRGQERRGISLLHGLLWLVPVLALTALLSGWIAVMPLALHLKSPTLLTGAMAAWLLGAMVLLMGAGEAAAGLRSISRRWRRLG